MTTPSVVALVVAGGAVAAAAGAVSLVWYLRRHRDRPGAAWFAVVLTAVAVYCAVSGVSLFVFDGFVRELLERVAFVSLCFMGPFFLAFGLAYTGRSDAVRGPLFALAAGVPTLTVVVAASNDLHGLLWTGFEVTPSFGAATVTYTLQPWGLFAFVFGLAMTGLGVSLLLEAIVSYGPLYRREAFAVIASVVPPTLGLLPWLVATSSGGTAPAFGLSLAAALFLPHVVLDGYAFVGTHMFDTNPTTQRAAERSGLEGFGEPVLVLDEAERVVNCNSEAKGLFGVAEDGLPVPLAGLAGSSLDGLLAGGDLTLERGGRRTFSVSHTPLTDSAGTGVGSLLVCYDVTEERQREQQLAVLNRVLRHNLRNELTVVQGYAGELADGVDSERLGEQARAVQDASGRLLTISEKVQTFEHVRDREPQYSEVAVADVAETVRREFLDSHPDASVAIDTAQAGPTVRTDPELLELVLSTLVENALVHAEHAAPSATVRVAGTDRGVTVEVCDENRPIPDIETDSLRAGDETPLQHGQGIGLWVVKWCIIALDAEITFEYDGGNRVTVTVPDEAGAGGGGDDRGNGRDSRPQNGRTRS